MARAVIFDVDGTLIDSVDLHAAAWQDAFRAFGRDVAFADVRAQIGKGGDQLLPVFLGPDEIEGWGEQLEERRSEIFKGEYLPKAKAFPSVQALFERLHAEGITIALASSAKGDELQTYKRLAGIEHLVDAETSSDDAERSKPEPDIFHAVMERLGNPDPATVIVVGDSPYDAIAAGRAGLRTIGLRCGGFPEADLLGAGCVALFDDPADLLAQFAASPLPN